MKNLKLDLRQRICVTLVCLIMSSGVIIQAVMSYKIDIAQQKEKARLNAKVYAEELRNDFENGHNITDAVEDTVIASNGKVNNFEAVASHEMEDYISSIQLAPDSKVEYIYPLKGNEDGKIDLMADKGRREIVSYSIRNRKVSMQGPFELKQGGYGIAVRNPIYIRQKDGTRKYWGLSIVIIKVPDIFDRTLGALGSFGYDYCLDTTYSPISLKSVRVASSTGDNVKLVNPVSAKFQAGGCTWTLNVERVGGWSSARLLTVLLSGLFYVIFSTVITYLLLRTKKQHKELVRAATTDELTGLLSRRGFIETLTKEMSRDKDKMVTAVFIDLDDFKQINDLYGHVTGDAALVNLANNLIAAFPKSSIIGRTGGDEFCVMIIGKSPEESERLIREAVGKDQTFFFENKKYSYTISAGYVDYPGQTDDLKKLINYADEALYSAKLAGKHRCVRFDSSMADIKRTQLGFSFKTLAEGIPGAFMIYCAQGREDILFANNDLINMMGCRDLDEFISLTGGSFRGFVHPDDLDLVETSIWQQMLERRDDPFHRDDYVEYRVKKKDGSILSVVDIGRLISTENYGEIFFVFIRTKGELAINV